MTEAVDIAIITATASTVGGLIGAASIVTLELIKGRGEGKRAKEAREHEVIAERKAELKNSFSATTSDALRFALSVGDCRNAEQTDSDSRSELRSTYLSAIQSAETLWINSDSRVSRKMIEGLRRDLEGLLSGVESQATHQIRDPFASVILRLRQIGISLYPTKLGRDDWEYQKMLEDISEDKKQLGI